MPFRCRTYHRVHRHPKSIRQHTAGVSYTAAQVAQRYSFPTVSSSTQRVAIIELGGGYTAADVAAYCTKNGFPVPPIRAISVDGALNAPTGNPDGPDGEVALDVQVIIGATRGLVALDIYFAQNTSTSFANAFKQIAADNLACAVSVSWGQNERGWGSAAIAAMSQEIALCESLGMSVFLASGDNGSSDGSRGQNADYPASDPSGCGCGGTTMPASGVETVWNGSGGGYSQSFPRPSWQTISGMARGVPDVAGDADPATGYEVVIDGQWGVIGGTSAVAPLWAALTALLVTITGKRLGNMAKLLWSLPAGETNDVTSGSNGAYNAGIGWDPCTGLGTPNGAKILAAISPPVTPPPVVTPPPPVTTAPTVLSSVLSIVIPGSIPSVVCNGVSIPLTH